MNYRGLAVTAIVVATLGSVLTYSWCERNPLEKITGAEVLSIEPHMPYLLDGGGKKVQLSGEEHMVIFPLGLWDSRIQEGDTIDAVVRTSLKPGTNLTGHCIYLHKKSVIPSGGGKFIIPIEEICSRYR